jgi:phage terminase large subunit-like protein
VALQFDDLVAHILMFKGIPEKNMYTRILTKAQACRNNKSSALVSLTFKPAKQLCQLSFNVKPAQSTERMQSRMFEASHSLHKFSQAHMSMLNGA